MNAETLQRIEAILAEADGVETDIASVGRENMRAVNRLGRVVAVKRVGGEKTFQCNVSFYDVAGGPGQLVIGAERAGGGRWRTIARWAQPSS